MGTSSRATPRYPRCCPGPPSSVWSSSWELPQPAQLFIFSTNMLKEYLMVHQMHQENVKLGLAMMKLAVLNLQRHQQMHQTQQMHQSQQMQTQQMHQSQRMHQSQQMHQSQ